MVTLDAIPVPRMVPERPMTLPQRQGGYPARLEPILDICWNSLEEDVLKPLLEADDLPQALNELWDAYRRWSHVASDALIGVVGEQEALRFIDEAETAIRRLNASQGERLLGHAARKAIDAALDLRSLVRRSLSILAGKPRLMEAATVEIGKLVPALSANDLCLATVIYYLKTEDTKYRSNAETLSAWSYHYVDLAYCEWGFTELDLGLSSKLPPQ